MSSPLWFYDEEAVIGAIELRFFRILRSHWARLSA